MNSSMSFSMLAVAALSACAPNATLGTQRDGLGVTNRAVDQADGSRAQQVKNDLESAIVERFGAAALKRAYSAEAYVLSRHYQGLAPAPEPGAGQRVPIAAILIFEDGRWYRGETGGVFRPLDAGQEQQWLAALADDGPWSEPIYANPTCTDAGGTYLIVSLRTRPFLLRAANCATPKSERLGLAAINL